MSEGPLLTDAQEACFHGMEADAKVIGVERGCPLVKRGLRAEYEVVIVAPSGRTVPVHGASLADGPGGGRQVSRPNLDVIESVVYES